MRKRVRKSFRSGVWVSSRRRSSRGPRRSRCCVRAPPRFRVRRTSARCSAGCSRSWSAPRGRLRLGTSLRRGGASGEAPVSRWSARNARRCTAAASECRNARSRAASCSNRRCGSRAAGGSAPAGVVCFVDDMQVLLQLRVGVHLHDVLQRPLDECQGRPDLVGDFGEEVDFGSVQLLLLLGLEQPLLFEYLLAFASQVVAESGGGASGDDEQVGDLGQPRAPPRRADDDLQRPFRALPAAVAVDGPDAERVVARLKLGEGDRT